MRMAAALELPARVGLGWLHSTAQHNTAAQDSTAGASITALETHVLPLAAQ
jgi:hypothetical protein